MKRTILLVALLMLILCVPALSVSANSDSMMAIKDSAFTVYIGVDNYLYATNSSTALCEIPARSLVYADDSKVLFTAADDSNRDAFPDGQILYELALNAGTNGEPQLITVTATDVLYIPQDGLCYYLDQQDDGSLMGYSPVIGATRVVTQLAKSPSSLRASIDGLVVGNADGDQLYIMALNQFVEAPTPASGMTIRIGNQLVYETLIDAQGNLSMRVHGQGSENAIAIDTNVTCAVPLSGTVYYLKNQADTPVLLSYDYASRSNTAIGRFKSDMLPEITAAGTQVFLMSQHGKIFSMDTETHVVTEFFTLQQVDPMPTLWATSDILIVYDASGSDGGLKYVTSFPLMAKPEELPIIEPGAQPTPVPALPEPEDVENEEDAEDEVEDEDVPPLGLLTRGSRGDYVLQLQDILKERGYPVGTADGIYGGGTANAVKYMQYDMGIEETGTVTPDYFAQLKSGKNLPRYTRFVEMEYGDSGIRVYDLQQRLISLGWMTKGANGNFGPATREAVQSFADYSDLGGEGRATVTMLRRLFDQNAPSAPAPKPDPTPKPDSGPHRAREISEDDLIELCRFLNDRFPGSNYDKKSGVHKLQTALYEQGYLKKSQRTKIYDEHTYKAMYSFQEDNALNDGPTGKPDFDTLHMLFPHIPEPQPMEPEPGSEIPPLGPGPIVPESGPVG